MPETREERAETRDDAAEARDRAAEKREKAAELQEKLANSDESERDYEKRLEEEDAGQVEREGKAADAELAGEVRPGSRPIDFRRLRTGEAIAGASAILLFLCLLLKWFSVTVTEPGGTVIGGVPIGGDAWTTLHVAPYVLVLIVILVLGNTVRRVAGEPATLGLPVSAVVTILGLLAAAIVLFRIISPPEETSTATVSVNVAPQLGIFLSFAAALGIALGGYLTMREEGVSFRSRPELKGRASSRPSRMLD